MYTVDPKACIKSMLDHQPRSQVLEIEKALGTSFVHQWCSSKRFPFDSKRLHAQVSSYHFGTVNVAAGAIEVMIMLYICNHEFAFFYSSIALLTENAL